MDLKPLHVKAAKQHGLVTRFQAQETGISKWQWFRLHEQGLLIHVHPNVSSVFGYEPTWLQNVHAATLSGDGQGIASHKTAAALWNVWKPSENEFIDIIRIGRKKTSAQGGVKFHHPRDHLDIAPIRREGIRVTTATRTLLDFAAVAPHLLPITTERMLMESHISRGHLIAAVARHSKRGRAGIGPVRDLLATWPYADKPADSVLELEMQRLLSKYDFPKFDTQISVGPYVVDLGWPECKVASETDGWGKYEQRSDFERLAKRDIYLQKHGWSIAHFTWRDVKSRPRYVVQSLRDLLKIRGYSGFSC
jgi:very-short-patch-repair endonuclease